VFFEKQGSISKFWLLPC